MDEQEWPKLTHAQRAMWEAFTDQRCANFVSAADFISDLKDYQKDFLSQSGKETLEFLRTMRPEEVKGLQAYLALRSTGSFMLWGIGTLVAGFIAVTSVWGTVSGWLKGIKP